MSVKTFSATRAPVAGDTRDLTAWHLSAGAVALVVNFCEETSAAPIFQVQVPVNGSASATYLKHLSTPNGGRWHVEVVSGNLNRGAIDLV
jgi:hypothetical protein